MQLSIYEALYNENKSISFGTTWNWPIPQIIQEDTQP
jgi:hypothetical protein